MTKATESNLSTRADGTPDARSGNPLATKGREFFCEHCRARCTRGTDGSTEYGHRFGCPDRPDEFPNHDTNEYERYLNRTSGTDQ